MITTAPHASAQLTPLWAKQDQNKYGEKESALDNNPVVQEATQIAKDKWFSLDGTSTPIEVVPTVQIPETKLPTTGSLEGFSDRSTADRAKIQEFDHKKALENIRSLAGKGIETTVMKGGKVILEDSWKVSKNVATDGWALVSYILGINPTPDHSHPAKQAQEPNQQDVQKKINQNARAQQENEYIKMVNDRKTELMKEQERLGVHVQPSGGEITSADIHFAEKQTKWQQVTQKLKQTIAPAITGKNSNKLGVNTDQGFEGKNVAQNLHG